MLTRNILLTTSFFPPPLVSASAYAAAQGLPALSGSVMGHYDAERLIQFYAALGGTIQPDHAIASLNSPLALIVRAVIVTASRALL